MKKAILILLLTFSLLITSVYAIVDSDLYPYLDAYYTFEDPSTVTQSSEIDNATKFLTGVNTPSIKPGWIGNSWKFEQGNSEYALAAQRDWSNSNTTCAWINITNSGIAQDVFCLNKDKAGDHVLNWRRAANGRFYALSLGDWGAASPINWTFVDDEWNFWCMVLNGTHFASWINGTLINAGADKPTMQAEVETILNAFNNTGSIEGIGHGHFDELMVFNKSLSAAEISYLYNLNRSLVSGGGAAEEATINLSVSEPANHTYWDVSRISFNLTMNSSNITNASFYVNGTLNQSQNNIAAGNEIYIEFNVTFSADYEANLTYEINITDGTTNATGTNVINFLVDRVNPTISTNLDNNDTYHTGLLNFSVNLSDAFLKNFTMISSCQHTFENVTLTDGTDNFMHVMNITNCSLSTTQHINTTVCDDIHCIDNMFNFSAMAELVINATSIIDGSLITNFTIYVNGTKHGLTTTGIYNLLNLSFADYNISINATGYAFDNVTKTITINYSTHEFFLYTVNSINFTFKDEETDAVLKGFNISIDLISDLFSYNSSTVSGYHYVDLLVPGEYMIRYTAENHSENFYFLNLINNTHNNITLYALSNVTATTVTITVYDEISQPVEGAYVKILRYNIDSNLYVLVSTRQTNFEGQTKAEMELNNPFYKFIIEYPLGTIRKVTEKTQIYTSTLDININLGEAIGALANQIGGVSTVLGYVNATHTFSLTYSDNGLQASQICLKVYKLSTKQNTLHNSTCNTASTGSLFITIPLINNTNWRADATGLFSGSEIILDSLEWGFFTEIINTRLALFLNIILTLVFLFIGARFSMSIALILLPLPTLIFTALGWIPLSGGAAFSLLVLSIIIAIVISKRTE